MICHKFMHIHIGRCGGSMVRNFLSQLQNGRQIRIIEAAAHLPLYTCKEFLAGKGWEEKDYPVPFTFVRNPFDYHIAFWEQELRTKRHKGTFRDFILNYEIGKYIPGPVPLGSRLFDFWVHMGGQEIEHVGQMEHLKRDLIQIVSELDPSIPKMAMEGCFPRVYTANGMPPYVMCIEQYMREELYTPELKDYVLEHDAYFLDRWGYTFEDRYE